MKNKDTNIKKKNTVGNIYIALSLLIAAVTVIILWKSSYAPWRIDNFLSWLKLIGMVAAYVIIYHFFARMYRAYRFGIYRLTELVYSQALAFGIANIILYVEGAIFYHRFVSLKPLLLTYLGQIAAEIIIVFVVNRLYARYYVPKEIALVCGCGRSDEFVKKVEAKNGRYIIRYVFEENEPVEKIEEIIPYVESLYLYEVRDELKYHFVQYCTERQVDVYITKSIPEMLIDGFETSHTFDTPFSRTNREPVKWYYNFVKRVMDLILSLVGIVILSPVFLAVSVCIKLYDRGPVFYKQERLTKDHRVFEIYKFRSMKTDAERDGEARLAQENDERITPVGKVIRATRIDELPQLINIIRGDMSIVGPRPERPEIERDYLKALPEFGLRLGVKAGLTGYAQVFGKYNTTPYDKLRLDLLYINRRSVLLDLKLILWTIKIIFIPESTEGVGTEQKTAIIEKENTVDDGR